ncbi:MAG: hypothetical protein IT529_21370 [Burkholderiales bacterium]|nr:hypothetical protein [Burkholderiales bacterium]
MRLAPALCLAALAGCAAAPAHRTAGAGDERADCVEVFRRIDAAVDRAGTGDGMSARVAGFPYLRVDRFLASHAAEPMPDAAFAQWMRRMAALGAQAHAIEIGNLPSDEADRLAQELRELSPRRASPRDAAADCAARLARLDEAAPERRAALREAAVVPDDYSTALRIAGLYWLTRVPFAAGVRRWQEETRAVFARPLAALPVRGTLRVYVPPPGSATPARIGEIVRRAADNPLGIPDARGEDLEALYRAYAPVIEIDTAGDFDLPGELGWGASATPELVTRRPVVYRRVSHARYGGRVLLQLDYSIWFAERPKAAGWDLLGGRLDGVLWRVTLAPDGAPWLFDTMHLCGCYHQFFPAARARARPQPETLEETAFVPQSLPAVGVAERVAVRLASATHYVERVRVGRAPAAGIEYAFADDDTLRSRPLPGGGRRSVFRPDGIVPGSERAERYFFWPMGIVEPGAMRQWGRHATAFVGRRHFDDPRLMERYFSMLPPGADERP